MKKIESECERLFHETQKNCWPSEGKVELNYNFPQFVKSASLSEALFAVVERRCTVRRKWSIENVLMKRSSNQRNPPTKTVSPNQF